MYHPDGAEKHPQCLESVLENSEPLKPMNCDCLSSIHAKRASPSNISNSHAPSFSHSRNEQIGLPNQKTTLYKPSGNNQTLNKGFANPVHRINSVLKDTASLISEQSPTLSEVASDRKIISRDPSFVEELFDDEDNGMGKYYYIFGSLF